MASEMNIQGMTKTEWQKQNAVQYIGMSNVVPREKYIARLVILEIFTRTVASKSPKILIKFVGPGRDTKIEYFARYDFKSVHICGYEKQGFIKVKKFRIQNFVH